MGDSDAEFWTETSELMEWSGVGLLQIGQEQGPALATFHISTHIAIEIRMRQLFWRIVEAED